MKNLGDLLQAWPDKHSTVIEVDADDLSYRSLGTQQLEQLAQSTAAYLKRQGYRPGDRIALVSNNCLEFIFCYLGICKLGATAVLISANLPRQQVVNLLDTSGSILVLCDHAINTDLPVITFDQLVQALDADCKFESYEPCDQDVAVVLHTSGSTGQPKRALITHRSRNSIFDKNNKQELQNFKKLFANPFCHAMGMNTIDLTLFDKHDLIFLKKFVAHNYLKTIHKFRPTHLVGVPSMFSIVVNQSHIDSDLDLSSVANILMAGGPAQPSLFDQLSRTFKNAFIKINYGSTELGPGVFGSHPTLPTPTGSVGCELPGIMYRLNHDVLEVRTPSIMKGYDDNSDCFTNDGYYVTNDIFTKDANGFYYFVGRSDDMFKSGDHKIYPAEIEQALESHPGVNKCVVIPISDPIKYFKPYAFVTLKNTFDVPSQDLKNFLFDKLAHYQLPREIWIIDQMPLTAVNKIDKQKLKSLAEQKLAI